MRCNLVSLLVLVVEVEKTCLYIPLHVNTYDPQPTSISNLEETSNSELETVPTGLGRCWSYAAHFPSLFPDRSDGILLPCVAEDGHATMCFGRAISLLRPLVRVYHHTNTHSRPPVSVVQALRNPFACSRPLFYVLVDFHLRSSNWMLEVSTQRNYCIVVSPRGRPWFFALLPFAQTGIRPGSVIYYNWGGR
jgi:hypothetical protein